ncbi:MAG: type II secretion system protein [Candidatus Sumerlaeia bacterium]
MRTHAARRGFTLTELIVASAISALAGIGIMSLVVYSSRIGRSVGIQQRSVVEAQSALEGINRAVRPATMPLRVRDDDGNTAAAGNWLELAWQGETLGTRTIRLVSDDDNLQTPWDNRLVYDPNTSQAGDEVVLARWVTPIPGQALFTYQGDASSLVVRLRAGDSLDESVKAVNNAKSGPGLQGTEITATVAPRNG